MADIIVKDRDGTDVTHEGAARIRTRTTDGSTKEFVDESSVPAPVETTVELDFSTGKMEVLPVSGEVFTKVNIPKPLNLIPEYIAKDVNIAGIIGALVASGGTPEFVRKYSYVYEFNNTSGASQTVKHNLGVVPDIVFLIPAYTASGNLGSGNGLVYYIGDRKKTLLGAYSRSIMRSGTTLTYHDAVKSYFEENQGSGRDVYNVTATQLTTPPLIPNVRYECIVIGNLYGDS